MEIVKMSVRWIVLAVAGVIVVAGLVVFNPLAPLFDGEIDTVETRREQGEISVSSLSATVEAEGELIFADQREIGAAGNGTLTDLADLGQQAEASTVLFEVDGEPTIALVGDVPAWRAMRIDDVGDDVAQLEANLVALGYDPAGELTVDDTFTEFTSVVVERWQEDLGLGVTGSVALGSVVFVPDSSRVTSVGATVGQSLGAPGASVLSVSSSDRRLSFMVEAADLDTIAVGTEISARLPDRSTVNATVIELAPTGDGLWTATAEMAPVDEGVVLPDGEAIPVTVTWTEVVASEVTTVRANALTRLDNGSYVLEVVDADDSTRFVPVGIGASTGSTVEVITDLPPGTVVVAP